jgi:hypothetical protein
MRRSSLSGRRKRSALRLSSVMTLRTKSVSDIPQCLVHVDEYLARQFFRRFSQELEPMLVLLGQIEHQGPRPRKASQVNPDKVMEHPAGRGVLSPLAFLVRERGLMRLEGLTDAGR